MGVARWWLDKTMFKCTIRALMTHWQLQRLLELIFLQNPQMKNKV